MATLAHAFGVVSGFTGAGFAPPLLLWLATRNKKPFAAGQAAEALRFQLALSLLFWAALAALIFGLGVSLLFIALYFAPCALLFGVVLSAIATVKVSNGQPYRYPIGIALPWIK